LEAHVDTSHTSLLAGFISEEELAAELKCCERTLARWRKLQIGPPYAMAGKVPIYNVELARAWLMAGGTNGGASKARRRNRAR
jgi:hypothetical protein